MHVTQNGFWLSCPHSPFQPISTELSTMYLKRQRRLIQVCCSKVGIEVTNCPFLCVLSLGQDICLVQPCSLKRNKSRTARMLVTSLRLQRLFQEISQGSNQISQNNYSVQSMNSECHRRLGSRISDIWSLVIPKDPCLRETDFLIHIKSEVGFFSFISSFLLQNQSGAH